MTHLKIAACLLVASFAACTEAPLPEDAEDATFLDIDGKSDRYGIDPDGPEAQGVLAVANTYSRDELRAAGVLTRAANNVVAGRANGPYTTLAELDAVPYTGPVFFAVMLDEAFAAGLVATTCGNGVLDGREFCDDGNTSDGDGCSSACDAEWLVPTGFPLGGFQRVVLAGFNQGVFNSAAVATFVLQLDQPSEVRVDAMFCGMDAIDQQRAHTQLTRMTACPESRGKVTGWMQIQRLQLESEGPAPSMNVQFTDQSRHSFVAAVTPGLPTAGWDARQSLPAGSYRVTLTTSGPNDTRFATYVGFAARIVAVAP